MDVKYVKLIEHIEELRNRILVTAGTFLVFLAGSFLYVKPIYQWLIKDLDIQLTILSPGDIIWAYMMISAVITLAMTIPIAAYRTREFTETALSPEERKVTIRYIPALFLLFLCGLGFGYFLLLPMVFGFLTNLSDGQFELMFTVEKYFKFVFNKTHLSGVLFEMPLVVLLLPRLGLLRPATLNNARKTAYFILIVVSVLITVPDFISDILVIMPLLVLYEISISLSSFVYKKRLGTVGQYRTFSG